MKNPGNVPSDPIASLESMMNITDKINNKAMEIANRNFPQQQAADPNAGSIRAEEIRSSNSLALKQMDHIHELAMKELDFKMIQMQTELAKWGRDEQNKSQTWNDALSGILTAFQHGVKETVSPTGGISQQQASPVAPTQNPNVENVQCDGCNSQFTIYRSAPVYSCPSCSKVFDRREQSQPAQAPGAQGPQVATAAPQNLTDDQGKGNE
jgi:hypothetical protein